MDRHQTSTGRTVANTMQDREILKKKNDLFGQDGEMVDDLLLIVMREGGSKVIRLKSLHGNDITLTNKQKNKQTD